MIFNVGNQQDLEGMSEKDMWNTPSKAILSENTSLPLWGKLIKNQQISVILLQTNQPEPAKESDLTQIHGSSIFDFTC